MEKIDFDNPDKYQLLIRLHWPNEASFYVYSEEAPEAGYYEKLLLAPTALYIENLKDAVFNSEYLSLNYEKTRILLTSGSFTFVPDNIYRKNEPRKDSFFQFNFENADIDKILTDEIAICKIVNLFETNKNLYDFLQRTFPYAEYTHYITVLLQYFLKQRVIGEPGRMFIRIHNDDLSIFCFRANQIEAVNSFSCHDINDAAYFILTLWDRLRFDQLVDGLHVAGNSDKKPELITILSRFIENVIPMKNPLFGKNSADIPFDMQAYLNINRKKL